VVCALVSSGSSHKIGGETVPAFEEAFLQNAVRDLVCALGAHCSAAELQNKHKKEVVEGGAAAEGSLLLAGGSAHGCEAMNKEMRC